MSNIWPVVSKIKLFFLNVLQIHVIAFSDSTLVSNKIPSRTGWHSSEAVRLCHSLLAGKILYVKIFIIHILFHDSQSRVEASWTKSMPTFVASWIGCFTPYSRDAIPPVSWPMQDRCLCPNSKNPPGLAKNPGGILNMITRYQYSDIQYLESRSTSSKSTSSGWLPSLISAHTSKYQ